MEWVGHAMEWKMEWKTNFGMEYKSIKWNGRFY